MVKKILLGLIAVGAVLIVALVVAVSTRPDHFRVSRSAVIPAAPAVVFDHVNDLHRWDAWSPWAKLDPNAKITFAGPPAGKDSSMAWAGNDQVGEGKMTITESKPGEQVLLQLEFVKPFAGTSTTEFTFQPDSGGTRVTWTMSGENNFIGKAISLVMDCDKMMGAQFEQGLDNMKQAVAARP
jgi:uncharacterized protein YndB with AHSA1/START domain